MKKLLVCSAVSLGAALALVAAPAHAQDDVARKEAQNRLDEGLKLHDEGKDEEARQKFLQAYAVLKTANVLYDLARSEQLSRHEVDAIRHYKQYLRGTDPQITEQDRATVKGYIQELTARVGRVLVDAPAGTRLTIDGQTVEGEAPLSEPLDVAPGKHVVSGRRGEKSVTVEVTCTEGIVVTAVIKEEAIGSGGGEHRRRGFWTTGNTVGVLLGGVAIVAGGAGLFFWLDSKSKSDDINQLRATNPAGFCSADPTTPACQSLKDKIDSGHTSGTLGNVFFIGAGVTAAGALASFLFWPREKPRKEAAWVVPAVGPGTTGAAVVGQF
jgi:hypothetical protein